MRCVVLDLDGTLADTSKDLLAAANACFRTLGHGDVLHDGDAGTALRGGRAMLRLGLSRVADVVDEDLVTEQYPHLLHAYGEAIDVHTQFYPGALDAVARLRDRGIKVAICTNKPERLAEDLMARMLARHHFDSLIGADTLAVRKPDPEPFRTAVLRAGGDPARAIMVGDTQTDHDTARAAEVPSILVTFGPGQADVLALKADAYMAHYDELDEIAARFLGS